MFGVISQKKGAVKKHLRSMIIKNKHIKKLRIYVALMCYFIYMRDFFYNPFCFCVFIS